MVTLLGALVRDRTSPAVTLVGTAVVAVAFAPLRERLQRAADRLLYGDRANPYAALPGVGRRLDGGASFGADALAEITETVATSLRLPFVRVEVSMDGPSDSTMAAEWGDVSAELHEVVLTFRGERVGSLYAARRTPHDRFSSSELRLLDDLGRQVGVAAHAMLLTRDLQRSREELVTAREEERRRIRRDLHDGLGPALAGVALGLDAVSHLVHSRSDEAARLAEQLKQEVHTSLADVRRLVEDLRPPALSSRTGQPGSTPYGSVPSSRAARVAGRVRHDLGDRAAGDLTAGPARQGEHRDGPRAAVVADGVTAAVPAGGLDTDRASP
ncbi:histidine kinase [Dermatophilaceae bacterium Soc4.6]